MPEEFFSVSILRSAHKIHINSNHDLLFMFGLGFVVANGWEYELLSDITFDKKQEISHSDFKEVII